jgi:hypothetical protein
MLKDLPINLRGEMKEREREREKKEREREGNNCKREFGVLIPLDRYKSVPHIHVTCILPGITDSSNKKGGNPKLPSLLREPCSLPSMDLSIWHEPAVPGSRCSMQALGVTSGI